MAVELCFGAIVLELPMSSGRGTPATTPKPNSARGRPIETLVMGPSRAERKAILMNHAKAEAVVELQRSQRLSDTDRMAAEQMDAEELKLCRLMGVSPSDFFAQKIRDAASAQGVVA